MSVEHCTCSGLGLQVNNLLPGEVRGGLAAEVTICGGLLVASAVEVQVAGDHACTTSTIARYMSCKLVNIVSSCAAILSHAETM